MLVMEPRNSTTRASGGEIQVRLTGVRLRVEAQEVVPIEPCSADGRVEVEASMWSVEIVFVDPEFELDVALE